MMVRYLSGAVSVVECTYESRRLPDCFPETVIEIEGTAGAIVLRPGYTMELTVDGAVTSGDVEAPLLAWTERPWHTVQESVLATCAHMLEAIRAGREADTSAEDNLKTFSLAEAAYRSAVSGRAAAVM